MKSRWFQSRPTDEEMREELEAHVAMRAEHDRVDEAAARRRLGNTLRTREAMRRVWVAGWWDTLRQDARFTWRSWRRQPGFAVGAILVLALGLGASTALFAAVDRVLFRPLPYADPDRLVSVGLTMSLPDSDGSPAFETETMLDRSYVQVWDAVPPPFEAVTAMDTATCDIAEVQPERVRCGTVEHNFLRTLGVRVAIGRDFTPEDDVRGAPRVAIISDALWVRRYGADPDAVGRTVSIESAIRPVQQIPIVGVLPPGFEMPIESADILLPFQLRPLDPGVRALTFISTFARLRPDVTPLRAELMLEPGLTEMAALMVQAAPPSARPAWRVQPIRDRRTGDAGWVGWLLLGAVAAFLMIACVNVTNLMLARVAGRQREFAIRAAIGAGKIRLARLAIGETLLLSLVAGGLGLMAAAGLLRAFVAVAPPGIPGIADASVDVRVFAVALLLALVAGLAVCVWPAVAVFHMGGLPDLRSTGAPSPGVRPRLRFALVTAQIALTLTLLGGSALLLRSLWNIVSVPLGFDPARVVTLTASFNATRSPSDAQRAAFFEELLARASRTPGALSAALSDASAPLGAMTGSTRIGVDGRPADPGARHPTIRIRTVTPDYFDVFRIPLVSGRRFAETDRDGAPAVVLSESAERTLFPGERGLGRRIRPDADGPWHTVVGVAADVRNGQQVTDSPLPELYVIARRTTWGRVGRLALRTGAGPGDATTFLRQIVADLDPTLPITIETAEEQVSRLTAEPRFIASLISAFGTLALLLAAAGLYSVASYLVAQRRRDIGVRMALGAAPRDVARQVVGEAGRWIGAGALLGCALGWTSTRVLQSQLYQVDTFDPWSWAGALVTLALALVAAVFRPAHDAARVDPVTALRGD